jgi:hypothetical protein
MVVHLLAECGGAYQDGVNCSMKQGVLVRQIAREP